MEHRTSLPVTILVGLVVTACGSSPQTATTLAETSTTIEDQDPTSSGANPSTSTSTVPILDLDGRIVFARAGGVFGDETIFTANADGTAERQLTEYGESCCVRVSSGGSHVMYSALAPDGQRITIAIQDLESGAVTLTPLPDDTANLGAGAWAPEDERIAVQLWDESDPSRDGVYTVAKDGSDLIRVTDAETADNPADYAPDGSKLVVFRESLTQSDGELFIVDIDGRGELARITPEGMTVGFGSAHFAPDGSRIIFDEGRTSSTGALWTIKPDGTDLRNVFEDSQGRFASDPAFSPDGSMIMFALNPIADSHEHQPNALYVVDSDGSNLRLVIGGDDHKRATEWFD